MGVGAGLEQVAAVVVMVQSEQRSNLAPPLAAHSDLLLLRHSLCSL